MNNDDSQLFGYTKEIGNEIKIYFADRRVLTGKLLGTNSEALFVEVKDKEVTVFKHAVKYIVEATEK